MFNDRELGFLTTELSCKEPYTYNINMFIGLYFLNVHLNSALKQHYINNLDYSKEEIAREFIRNTMNTYELILN